MQRTTFHLMTDEVPRAALELAATGCFSPDQSNPLYRETLTSTPTEEYREFYQSAHHRFDKIYHHLGIELPFPPLEDIEQVPDINELRNINDWLAELWSHCSECEEDQRELDEEIQLTRSLQTSLHNFYGLDIDLAQLRQKKTFLDMQVGLVPEENLSRLRRAASLAGYIIEVFHREKHQVHILIAGVLEDGQENIQSVLQAAGYRTFPIPEAFSNTPDKLHEELDRRYEELLEQKKAYRRKQVIKANENMDDLLFYWRVLKLIEPGILLENATRSKGSLAVIHGWIPETQLSEITRQLQQVLKHPIHVESHAPKVDEYEEVPTLLRYPRWMMPFVILTRNYGTPRYAELDPTWLFAFSSILLFGMMFGDVGHGFVLVFSAVIFKKLLKNFSFLLLANGLSSIGFGFVYGSLFGNEHLLTPIWQSPLSEPASILLLAIYFGMVFVGISMLSNIYNLFTIAHYRYALLSPGGLPGLIGLLGMYLIFTELQLAEPSLALPLIMLAIVFSVMAYSLWLANTSPPKERFIIVPIELLETMISLVSNVLSFLRVGAFSLNHIALMLAVFAMAEMLTSSGYWIIIILGNLFVIGFEAAIVMIQVLRLEYYEGLSRYFKADGKVFKPLKLAGPSTPYLHI